METDQLIPRIVGMEVFLPAFDDLKGADFANGEAIEKALRTCLEDCHAGLAQSAIGPERIRYLLFREAVEVKAQASAFLNYEREMASREAALWRFALTTTEDFFNVVGDALDGYFQTKAQVIVEDVENAASWCTGLTDTAKKGGAIVNVGAHLLKKGASYVSDRLLGKGTPAVAERIKRGLEYTREIPDEDLIDTRDVVRKAIDRQMSQETLAGDVQGILSEAGQRYQEAWRKEIRAQTPDLSTLQAFAAGASGRLPERATFELGAAEQTLAIGLGGRLSRRCPWPPVGTFWRMRWFTSSTQWRLQLRWLLWGWRF